MCIHFFRRTLCITSHHSAAEHRASTRILHLTLFLASVLISIQVFLTLLTSPSTLLLHVFLCLPQLRLRRGLHSRACFATLSGGPRSVCSSHPHLQFLICKSIFGCFIRFPNSSFVLWSGQKTLHIFLRHLLIKTYNLAVIHFEFFQVSQAVG